MGMGDAVNELRGRAAKRGQPSAIVLAAGESTRMGRTKALLPWGDGTLIEYQVRELRAAGVAGIVVVLGHDAEAVGRRVPEGTRAVVNEAYREGRASSLRAGAAALPDGADPVVVMSVDQPRPRDLLRKLLDAHAERSAPVTLPVSDGRRGHPVIVAGVLLPELRAASDEEQGLRGIIERHKSEVHEVPLMMTVHESNPDLDLTPLIALVDINTPEDYEQARALFGFGAAPQLDS
jgi:molybdenum cofactor cytidylyltransferase